MSCIIEYVAMALYGIPEPKLSDCPLAAWTDLSEECRESMRDRARAALTAAQEWRPMVTAPRDGTPILTFAPDNSIAIGHWQPDPEIEGGGTWRDDGADPTHWMLLPLGPLPSFEFVA